jgi:hypothetical protein
MQVSALPSHLERKLARTCGVAKDQRCSKMTSLPTAGSRAAKILSVSCMRDAYEQTLRSCEDEFLADAGEPDVRCGSKTVFAAQKRDFRQLGHRGMSQTCHTRTHALPQIVFYSITSSAICCKCRGTSMPSAFAVLRLMTSSYFVGACTGRSAGLSPFRIRSTYPAERRTMSPLSGP